MRKITLILLCIAFLNICAAQRNLRSHLITDLKSNIEKKDYKKIMIISSGSTVFRAFSESLSDQLQQDFISRNIQSDFLYIGNKSKTVKQNFSDIIKRQDFDALMVILQTDT